MICARILDFEINILYQEPWNFSIKLMDIFCSVCLFGVQCARRKRFDVFYAHL